jgi:hypothetical protein
LHNPLFSQIQRSLLMGDVFVTMLAYRKFFPNCAWRAMLGLSRVEGFIRPLRRMVTGRADVYRVQSSSRRTGVKEILTRFGPSLIFCCKLPSVPKTRLVIKVS